MLGWADGLAAGVRMRWDGVALHHRAIVMLLDNTGKGCVGGQCVLSPLAHHRLEALHKHASSK